MDEQNGVTASVPDTQSSGGQENLDKKWYNKGRKFWPVAVLVVFSAVMIAGSIWLGIFGKSPVELQTTSSDELGPLLEPLGIKPSDSGVKNEAIVTGFVYNKNDGAVMLTTDEAEVWSVVKRTPGQTVSLIVGGALRKPIEWSDIQPGLPIEIKTPRVIDNDPKVLTVRKKSDGAIASPAAK